MSNRRDSLTIAGLLLAGVLGLATFVTFYDEAFPVASLDLKVGREDARSKSAAFLETLGFDLEGYESAQALERDWKGQVFLERTLGLEETNRLIREWVSIWWWDVRWFRPGKQEEMRVGVSPDGRVVGFHHIVPDSMAGAVLGRDDARVLAEGFLRGSQNMNLEDWELIDQSTMKQIARTDHELVYRKLGFSIGDGGEYRLSVSVIGDQVGECSEFVHVPEVFQRNREDIRSRAGLLTSAASVFWVALVVVSLVLILRGYRQKTFSRKKSLFIAAIVAGVTLVAGLNGYPLIWMNYDTTGSFGAFLSQWIIGLLVGALFLAAIVGFAASTGEYFGRQILFGGRRSPFDGFSFAQSASWSYLRSTAVGYGLAFASLGYVTVFYLVGTQAFGVWSPAQTMEYRNSFGTLLPWVYPLLIGLRASTIEEFFFRLIAIPLMLKWTGRRWIAVLAPAIVWGFLHSNYPTEPIATRGIELTVVGVVYGIVFLRFGIWATIVSHYAYNAFLGSLPMLLSSNPTYQASGVAVIGGLLLPFIPFGISLARGRVKDEGTQVDLLGPEAVREPEVAPKPVPDRQDRRALESYELSRRQRTLLAVVAVTGAALALMFQGPRFGERSFDLKVTRADAFQLADGFLAETGRETESYRSVLSFTGDSRGRDLTYLVRQLGMAKADSLTWQLASPWLWKVRYFRPNDPEEIVVGVDPSGSVVMLNHVLPEDATGDSLAESEALSIARGFAEEAFGREVGDASRFEMQESESRRLRNRVEHRFVWEQTDAKVGDGQFLVATSVQGNRPDGFSTRFQAPEAFHRRLQEHGVRQALGGALLPILLLVTLFVVGWRMLRAGRAAGIQWGSPKRAGLVAAVVLLTTATNEYPEFLLAYDTSVEIGTYVVERLVGRLMMVLVLSGGFVLLLAAGQTICSAHLAEESLPSAWDLRRTFGMRGLWCDSFLAAGAIILGTKGISSLGSQAIAMAFPQELWASSPVPRGMEGALPALGVICTATIAVGLVVNGVACATVSWMTILRRRWILQAAVLLVAGVSALSASSQDPAFLMATVALRLVLVGYIVWFATQVVGYNLLAYKMALWMALLIPAGWEYVNQSHLFYKANGVILLAVGSLPFLVVTGGYLLDRLRDKPLPLSQRPI